MHQFGKALVVHIWNGTFAIFAVFSSLLVAHNLVKSYGKDGIAAGTVSVASFFAVGGLEGMGATGIIYCFDYCTCFRRTIPTFIWQS